MAHDAIVAARTRATYEANEHRQGDSTRERFSVGQKVYLSTENISVPRNRACKLVSKWIETSTYHLELPEALANRNIHTVSHAPQLRPHEESDEELFPEPVTHRSTTSGNC